MAAKIPPNETTGMAFRIIRRKKSEARVRLIGYLPSIYERRDIVLGTYIGNKRLIL
jgi:hypothetical protein